MFVHRYYAVLYPTLNTAVTTAELPTTPTTQTLLTCTLKVLAFLFLLGF